MAKQMYETKKTTKIIGTLDKDDDDVMFIRVEDKDNCMTYDVKDILDSMLGTVITLFNEENL